MTYYVKRHEKDVSLTLVAPNGDDLTIWLSPSELLDLVSDLATEGRRLLEDQRTKKEGD